MKRAAGSVVTVLAAMVLVGCAGNVIHRPQVAAVLCPLVSPPDDGQILEDPRVWDACRVSSIEIGPTTLSDQPYKLAVVELDDQGRFRRDDQLEKLFKLLDEEMVNARAGRTGGVSLVVFVHGWRHNADVDDPNLKFARTVLYKTVFVENQAPQYTPNTKPRSVVGIYVGWRGKSLTLPGLDFIELASFWDRKFTAERVATGSVRELFARLKYFREKSNKPPTVTNPICENKASPTDAPICPSVRLFIVGHSFGGLLVYNALSESLIRSVTEADLGGGSDTVVGEYADLVMLVNPAVEGARFEPLHQAVRRRQYNSRQLPIFVSVTATNDWATGLAFPFGRWWNTIFESESPDNPADPEGAERIGKEEREANVNAMGHIKRYKTHVLCLAAGPDECPPKRRPTSNVKQLAAEWGSALEAISDVVPRANCLAALQETLASRYLRPAGVRWDEGDDDSGRRVRYREFFNTEPKRLRLRNDGLTLRVHESLEGRINGAPSLIHTPVWMVESNNKQIIDGHNDFTRQPFRDFLIQLYHDRVMYGRNQEMLLNPETECRPKR